jgi:hypothetical protein
MGSSAHSRDLGHFGRGNTGGGVGIHGFSSPALALLTHISPCPLRSPVKVSLLPSRTTAHDSGWMKFAAPSLCWTPAIFSCRSPVHSASFRRRLDVASRQVTVRTHNRTYSVTALGWVLNRDIIHNLWLEFCAMAKWQKGALRISGNFSFAIRRSRRQWNSPPNIGPNERP